MKYLISKTDNFEKWFVSLKDGMIRRAITSRIERIRSGNFGDHKIFGNLGELRFKFGGGIRVYYTIRNRQVVIVLAGGNKSSQEQDFKIARAMIEKLED